MFLGLLLGIAGCGSHPTATAARSRGPLLEEVENGLIESTSCFVNSPDLGQTFNTEEQGQFVRLLKAILSSPEHLNASMISTELSVAPDWTFCFAKPTSDPEKPEDVLSIGCYFESELLLEFCPNTTLGIEPFAIRPTQQAYDELKTLVAPFEEVRESRVMGSPEPDDADSRIDRE